MKILKFHKIHKKLNKLFRKNKFLLCLAIKGVKILKFYKIHKKLNKLVMNHYLKMVKTYKIKRTKKSIYFLKKLFSLMST